MDFRDFLYYRFNVKQNEEKSREKGLKVLISKKHLYKWNSQCAIANIEDLVDKIKIQFPNFEVDFVDWRHMPMGEQIRKMSEVDIYISLPGSDLMVRYFLSFFLLLIIFIHFSILLSCKECNIYEERFICDYPM